MKKNKIDLMGCLETRVKEQKSKKIIANVARDWRVVCNYPHERNGRIWLMWQTHVKVQVVQMAGQWIHCLVFNQNGQTQFFLTVVFAYNDVQ